MNETNGGVGKIVGAISVKMFSMNDHVENYLSPAD